jgi:rubrerythrin
MFAKRPINLQENPNCDLERLRFAISAEFDAINFYEQLSGSTNNKDLQAIFNDVIQEEKVHVSQFQTFLLQLDPDQADAMDEGQDEDENLLSPKSEEETHYNVKDILSKIKG